MRGSIGAKPTEPGLFHWGTLTFLMAIVLNLGRQNLCQELRKSEHESLTLEVPANKTLSFSVAAGSKGTLNINIGNPSALYSNSKSTFRAEAA